MANRNTKRKNLALRKAGEHFHGVCCDTKGRGCNFPKPESHPFVAARERFLKMSGRL